MRDSSAIDTPDRLTPARVAALLAATSTAIQESLAAMPPVLLTWRPAPGEWCALEVLGT